MAEDNFEPVIEPVEPQQQDNKEMFKEFLEYFQESNGRAWDYDKDQITEQTWEAVGSGTPLKDAYKEQRYNEEFLKGFNSY